MLILELVQGTSQVLKCEALVVYDSHDERPYDTIWLQVAVSIPQ